MESGRPRVFSLIRRDGLRVRLTDLGATVMSIEAPDRDGAYTNVVLGLPLASAYAGEHPYLGATVGRYANRIAGGLFDLDGRAYPLARNDGTNHLHGGVRGFDKALWRPVTVVGPSVRFVHDSPAGDEGFPGRLRVAVQYDLPGPMELRILFKAETDAPTPVNLTHHGYFNLAGAGSGNILQHEITLAAEAYLPVDGGLIPTGEQASVEGTAFDFRRARRIADTIDRVPGGYDHTFVLGSAQRQTRLAARVREPDSGRVVEVHTNKPGIHFYTGNMLDGTVVGAEGRPYGPRSGLCLEPHFFPDSPNRPDFPDCILRPGAEYHHEIRYRFGVA